MKDKTAKSNTLNEVKALIRTSGGFIDVNKDLERYLIPICYLEAIRRGIIDSTNKDLISFANRRVKDDLSGIEEKIREILASLNDEQITQFVLDVLNDKSSNTLSFMGSSQNLCSLVYDLLEIEEGDTLYDLGTGYGVFLSNLLSYANNDGIHLSSINGIDINKEQVDIATMALSIINHNSDTKIDISCEDALKSVNKSYNKGYVFSPVGQAALFRANKYQSFLYPDITFNAQFLEQWVFIDRLLAGLNGENAKGVAITFKKTMLQIQNNEFAQRLLKDDWIEGIIDIPGGVIADLSVDEVLVMIFSRGNKTVKYQDVYTSKYFNAIPNVSYPEQGEIRVTYNVTPEQIFNDYMNNKDIIYSVEQIAEFDTWIPNFRGTVINSKILYTPLNQLADCKVCCQYTVSMFDVTEKDTGYRIITSSDIDNDGVIHWEKLVHVKMDKTTFDKYCVEKGDVIVTTKSSRIKVAVVDIDPPDNVIVTGGMFLIRTDKEKLDPTFLKMFLDSSQGKELIKLCESGTTIIHLGPSMFFGIGIPKTPIEKQREMAEKYNEKKNALIELKVQTHSIESELETMFDEEVNK